MLGRPKSLFFKRQQSMADLTAGNFDVQVLMKRLGHPVELTAAYVMLAALLSSHVSGTTIAVPSGKPIL